MVVDVIFDSLCRCFGDGSSSSQSPEQSTKEDGGTRKTDKRRTDRVSLKDKQFDALFEGQSYNMMNTPRRNNNTDDSNMEHAQAVARAKLQSSRHSPAKKRKSPATIRDEIFRTRDFEPREKPPPTNTFSRFLSSQNVVANALCFATPINDDEEFNDIMKTESDCNTLNTCEDTITSTLFFERKYAHIVEERPPMPLFHQFKVDTHEVDELRRIVANDSHNSMKMIQLMDDKTGDQVLMEESDEDQAAIVVAAVKKKASKRKGSRKKSKKKLVDDDVPPAVKIDSSASSSASSRR